MGQIKWESLLGGIPAQIHGTAENRLSHTQIFLKFLPLGAPVLPEAPPVMAPPPLLLNRDFPENGLLDFVNYIPNISRI